MTITQFKKIDLPKSEIRDLLSAGMTQADIANLFNVSQSTISRLVKKPNAAKDRARNIDKPCSKCGRKPVAKGNRFLCSECFASETVDGPLIYIF